MPGSPRLRIAWVLVCLAFACSDSKISGVNGGNGGSGGPGGGSGGASGYGADASSNIGFNRDALGAPTEGGGVNPLPGTPGSETTNCAAETHKAEQLPLDLLLLVDTSGSMNEAAGTQSKWQLARGALGSFWKDPRSAGLGLGLQFFPLNGGDKTCGADAECTGAGVVTPGVCGVRNVCVGNPFTLPARGCDPADAFCPAGSTCTPVGRCALSGGDCLRPGTPCPTGANGDMCVARGRICGNIGSGSCTQADYETLAVPIGALPAGEPALTRAITVKEPIGHTPTAPAVSGALAHLRAHLMRNPTHRGALILFTDGLPLGCDNNATGPVINAMMQARTGMPSIPTYVIGVFGNMQFGGATAVNQWANAGGTGMATVLAPGPEFSQNLLNTLNAIRGAALPCEFTIPPPRTGMLDYGKVNVRYTGTAGPSDILYVGRADRCDPVRGGWYYDVDPTMGKPTRVLICPATCDQFKRDVTASVDLVFGCATRVIP
jgi:hypothetical protein